MKKETIGLVIVIAAVLYIMLHHNNLTANAGSSGGGFLGGFLTNPLGVGSGGGGGGGVSLGGIGHNYVNTPGSSLLPPPGNAPNAPIRIGEPVVVGPITYKPPVPVASAPPASSGWVTTAPGSTYQSGNTVPVTSLQGLSYSQLFGLRRG